MSANKLLLNSLIKVASEFVSHSGVDPKGIDAAISIPFSNMTQHDWVVAVDLWKKHGKSFLHEMKERHCPVCGSKDSRHLFESYDGYPYVECISCTCWYVPLAVEEDSFRRFFEACPEAESVAASMFSVRETAESKEGNLNRIGSYLNHLIPLLGVKSRQITYLDLGCGLGDSLVAARQRGINAIGLESSQYCMDFGRRVGLDIRGPADSIDGKFDLISSWESLEHMINPLEVLSASAGRLHEDGLFAFTVPNKNSPMVRVQRADCSVIHGGYNTPGHINLFDNETLQTLFKRAGLTIMYFDGQYGLNLVEMVSYLFGRNLGAFDLLSSSRPETLQKSVWELFNYIGPVVSVLERLSLASPIIYGVACLSEASERLQVKFQNAEKKRNDELMGALKSISP